MQKIKNNGTKKFAKFPPDFEPRRAAGRAVRRRFGAAAADLFFKVVVLRVRVAMFFYSWQQQLAVGSKAFPNLLSLFKFQFLQISSESRSHQMLRL